MDKSNLIMKLTAVLVDKGFKVPSTPTLELEIDYAIGVINDCRRFTPSSNRPYDKKYEHLIVPMCVHAISKYGAEGESAHSENGISRTYSGADDYPKEILMKIIPLAK